MKKERNQAFTLIELIAIIVILGIILAITVPAVSNLINSTYVKLYQIDLASMKDAASGYVLKANVEVSVGVQSRIELSDMVAVGLIDKIVDPKSKEECTGYVTVTRLGEDYSYSSYLNCGSNYKSEYYDKTDFVLPIINLKGDNPVTINAGETYKEPGFTAYDDVDGEITSRVIAAGSINPNVPGTYEMTYSVTDNANNLYETKRTVNVVDTVSPTVTFETNGNSTYAKTRSTIVRVRDLSPINASSLKYLWDTSTTAPTAASFSSTFTNDGTVTSPLGVTGQYYLWIIGRDSSDNTAIVRSDAFYLDNTVPVITLNGSTPVTVNVGSTYSDAGATATDAHSGINGSVTSTGSVNPSVLGTYTIIYNVNDKSGNEAVSVIRTINVVDTVIPTVSFGTNGNTTYAQTRSTTVSVSDNYSLNTSSLKYQWTTSTTAPTETSFMTSFTNGGTISTPSGVTGGYYLWILAKDTSGNTTINRTNVFNLDNTKPVITMNGSANVTVNASTTYSDAGATATDNINGTIAVTSTGSVNTNVVGTYTITYNATDSSGNMATSVTRAVNVVDVTSPVITMNGSNPVTVEAGTTYSDAGATVIDAVDGNLTSRMTTTGTVNPSIVGSYTITYRVTDNSSNTATATRTINVVDTTAPTITTALAGTMLYTDPTFASGTNGTSVYNNSADGTVTVTRTAISGAPEGSGYGLTIKTTAGTSYPGFGGFYFATPTSASKVFITRIVAKIPVGYYINWTSNAYGGGTISWLTSQAGTGNWEEYIFQVNVGTNGSYSSTNFFYITGSPTPTSSSPLTWYVAYATVFDTTSWGTSNSVTFRAADNGSGIIGYGINQSSSTVPTFTTITANNEIGKAISNITANGTYYVWTKDASGNLSNKAVTVSYVDCTGPTIETTIAGTMLFTDPIFASGSNSMIVYNNLGNGTVTHTRIPMSTPVGSYAMQITINGSASPGLGGFYQQTISKANGIYIHKIIAKIPVGYTMERASNAIGNGASIEWLTSQAGTGNWQEYIYITRAGATGSFGSLGHVYLNGTAATSSNPITWYVAYATMFDTTTWGTNNSVLFKATDSDSGVNGYGINQSSSTAPTFTSVTTTSSLGTSINNITANGTYYVWTKDALGNTSNKSFIVSYVDPNAPTITANSSSYTITQGASNALPGTYFTINQNGGASISSTTCVDTTNGNATVSNTSTLAVGTHTIRCSTTKTTGLSANTTTNIVVNPAYTCSTGTLTNDATKGYICTIGASSQNWYTTSYQCTSCNSCTYTYPNYVYGGQSCTYCGGGQTVISQIGLGSRFYSTTNAASGTRPNFGDVYTGQSWIECSYCAGGCSGCGLSNCGTAYVCWHGNVSTTVTPCNTCDYVEQITTTGSNCSYCGCASGYNVYNYYCSTGWTTYSGSGSSLICYKAASQG